MILYRGQPTPASVEAARARRQPWLADAIARHAHEPRMMVAGRWFTDDLEIARWYVSDCTDGDGEIVSLEIDDALAETFRVANTPVTPCGLEPGRFSRDPDREFVLPKSIADRAVPLHSEGRLAA